MHKKSCYTPFLLALILTTLCPLTTPAQEAVIVHFPDKNLEAAIRKAINKPQGDILQTDLVGTGFTQFNARNCKIVDLSGLEYCTDLTSVNLRDNRIRNLSALRSLTNLRGLDLCSNQIGDISPLAGLINLQHLGLHGNGISDLSALAGLSNLENLHLNGNEISDVNALANLTGLVLEVTPIFWTGG